MKPFGYELATQKVFNVLDNSGLSKEAQRELLVKLLEKEEGLSNLGGQGREHIVDEIMDGKSVMFLDSSNLQQDKLKTLADKGRVKVSAYDGTDITRTVAVEDLPAAAVKGYATVIQPAEDEPIKHLTTVGRGVLSPEAAAMMTHQHLGGVNQDGASYGGVAQTIAELAQGIEEAEVARAAADATAKQEMREAALKGTSLSKSALKEIEASRARLDYSIAKGHSLLNKARRAGESYRLTTEKANRTPGEEFALQTQLEFREFVLQKRSEGVRDIREARAQLQALSSELAEKHGATPAQIRYVSELYDLECRSVTKDTKDEWTLCCAWAAAAEFVPDIHDYIEEFERRISLIYWPPEIDSAATMEATLMSITYCWSVFHAKTLTEWIETNDGEIIGNLLGVLASNGHTKIAMFITKMSPIKDIADLADFGLEWLDSNFSKLEIGHKLAASLCLTDVPDDVEVKAPWSAWSFVIPDGLLATTPRADGTAENFARVFCLGTKIRYLVGSKGRCVGPVSDDQSDAPESVRNLFKLLNSLIKGACLALSDPAQYKKRSISANEGSFKSKRVGGAPVLNNARFMLSADVQVDLRDVVHAVQRGERRKGGKLTVQFLVRGHWKNQVHGEHRALRKRIWIQPFWKGGEETRILLRNYVIRDNQPEHDESKDGQNDV